MTAVTTIAGFDIAQVKDVAMIGLFSTAGFSIRLVKKFISEGVHPWDYIRCYFVRTMSSWFTITGAAVTNYMTTNDMHAITYITMAYMADSLINKAPTQQELDAYQSLVAKDDKATVSIIAKANDAVIEEKK